MAELKAEYPNADLSEQKHSDKDGDETYRYIAVSE
jgi:hypothetical protein